MRALFVEVVGVRSRACLMPPGPATARGEPHDPNAANGGPVDPRPPPPGAPKPNRANPARANPAARPQPMHGPAARNGPRMALSLESGYEDRVQIQI